VPTFVSLLTVAAILAVAIGASILWPKAEGGAPPAGDAS